jgi:ATP-binding cassette subfamily B (MDR/TAP) protein 1
LADTWDIILMIIGTIASLITGATFPLMLIVYRRITDALVQTGIQNNSNKSIGWYMKNFIVNLFYYLSFSFEFSTSNNAPLTIVADMTKWYLILGFVSILCYYIGFSCWMMAAERQLKRMKYIYEILLINNHYIFLCRLNLFRSILYQDIAWFDTQTIGEIMQKLENNLDTIREGISDKVPDFISLAAKMFGCIILSVFQGWKLTLGKLNYTN